MPPDAAAAQPVLYSIAKDRDVIGFLKGRSSLQRDSIQEVIDNLQFNPRPSGHEIIKMAGIEIINIMVDGTQPKYSLKCIVRDDEEKVYVIAIVEKRFS
jgi:hypothetical protein